MVNPSATAMAADPVITRFRSRLEEAYGGRLDRVVLFGSRARGDFGPDSDYDVAVFIRDPKSRWDEMGILAGITVDFLLEDAFISAKPFPASAYWDETPLMRNVRREGVEL